MAFTTFDELVTEVIKWSHRDDLDLLVPDFITLAENTMYANEVQILNVRSMGTVSTALTDSKFLSLPPNFESMRSARLELDNASELQYQAPEQLRRQSTTGQPLFYSIVGNEIEFNRTPDSSYTIELQYFRRADPLTKDNQTNEILTKHPSIYLFGALTALYAHAQDTEEEQKNTLKFIGAIKGANKADKRGRYGSAPAMGLEGFII